MDAWGFRFFFFWLFRLWTVVVLVGSLRHSTMIKFYLLDCVLTFGLDSFRRGGVTFQVKHLASKYNTHTHTYAHTHPHPPLITLVLGKWKCTFRVCNVALGWASDLSMVTTATVTGMWLRFNCGVGSKFSYKSSV